MSNGIVNGTDGLESRFGESSAVFEGGWAPFADAYIVVQRLLVSMA